MIWIVIIVLLILVGNFVYDRYNMLEEIDSNGGLIIKYKILIDYMLSRSGGNITSKGKDHISIDYVGIGTLTHFSIIPGFDTVIVNWSFKCEPLATFQKDWKFDINKVSQVQMIEIIDCDIEKIGKPLSDLPLKKDISLSEVNYTTNQSDYIPSNNAVNNVLNDIFHKLGDSTITNLFTPLELEKQAKSLSIFIQIKHNNRYINSSVKNHRTVFNFDDYYDGYEFFKNFILEKIENRVILYDYLETVKNNPTEILRFTAILLAVSGDKKGRDEYLDLATITWEKLKHRPMSYAFNLLKTKVDLQIYSGEFFEAARICEEAWSFLELSYDENIGWLKYQFAIVIIVLSNKTKLNLNVTDIFESLDDFEEQAIFDDLSSKLR